MNAHPPEKRQEFLDNLSEWGSIHKAAELSGLSRRTVYEWRADDAEFAAKLETARALGIEHLEDIARRRAMENSDTLLMFMLRSLKPDVYCDKSRVDHTGSVTLSVAKSDTNVL